MSAYLPPLLITELLIIGLFVTARFVARLFIIGLRVKKTHYHKMVRRKHICQATTSRKSSWPNSAAGRNSAQRFPLSTKVPDTNLARLGGSASLSSE